MSDSDFTLRCVTTSLFSHPKDSIVHSSGITCMPRWLADGIYGILAKFHTYCHDAHELLRIIIGFHGRRKTMHSNG